jgi:enterochelin esterase-like enzyme
VAAVFASMVAASPQSAPIVRGDEVTFVAAGDRSDPPRIVADFNGWEGGVMAPSADGRTYTLHVTLDPAARIEYLIAYRERFVTDPGNPLSVAAPAGPPRSELRMPGYRPPMALPQPHEHGTVEAVAFASRGGDRRRIRVYVPALRRASSLLYVHDGDIALDKLELPALLDSLIEAGQMAPTIVAFIDAVDRHDDYEPGSPFRTVFVDEIVPAIERRFASANVRRALMGLSRSTVGALDTCVNGGLRFEACILVAPAIPPRQFGSLLPLPGSAMPFAFATRFAIATGTYDIPLVADARALRDELQRRRLSVQYSEEPQGHNHTAFRAALPRLMRGHFPGNGPLQ